MLCAKTRPTAELAATRTQVILRARPIVARHVVCWPGESRKTESSHLARSKTRSRKLIKSFFVVRVQYFDPALDGRPARHGPRL